MNYKALFCTFLLLCGLFVPALAFAEPAQANPPIYDLSGGTNAGACPVCGVCPRPFEICLFVLIGGVIAVVILTVIILKAMKKKCDRCGHTNWKSASVCKHCGHPLLKRHVPTTVVPAYRPKVEPYAKHSSSYSEKKADDGVYCIRCGVPLDSGVEVCYNCGTAQKKAASSEL